MIGYRILHAFLLMCALLPGCLHHDGGHRAAEKVRFPLPQPAHENPLQLLLGHLRLSEQDLAIEIPQDSRDHYFISKTEYFLRSPLAVESYTNDISRRLESGHTAIAPLLALAAGELEIDLSAAPPRDRISIPEMKSGNILPGIAPAARPAIMELLSAIVACRRRMSESFSSLSQQEILFLHNYFSEMLLTDKMMQAGAAPGRSAALPRPPLKSDQHYAKETAFYLPIVIRRDELYRAIIDLAAAIDRLLERSDQLEKIAGTAPPAARGELRGDIIAWDDTPWGTVIIGGKGPTYYSNLNPLLIIDLGGNDEYHNLSSSPSLSPFNAPASVIIDLEGNDLHRSTKKYSQGSAAFGCSFLVDCSGDDTYLAVDLSQGCGFFGVGVLDDRKGNDRYRADTMAQGAAAFGIGIIADREGNDSYHGSLYNQGSAFTGGLGLLIDSRGDDRFFAGGTYPDAREAEGAFVSFSQGCGFGDRQYASGGLGILFNGSGNDHYIGSYFAQGAGYWLGTGLLIDRAGRDFYEARRYAQGAATHRAVGALVDRSGDDEYASWGATQGCGYDFAQGLLSDAGGNDVYHAVWLAQGTGGKSGTGMLIDRRGNDSYQSGSFCSQGNGQYWEEEKTGSIGLAIDCGGNDIYTGMGKNNHYWRQGYYGGGIDTAARFEEGDMRRRQATGAPRLPAHISEPGTLELFKHCEPLPELEIDLNHEDERQAAVEQLARRGPSLVPRLLEYVRINDVQLSFTAREIITRMGADAAPVLRQSLNEHSDDPVVSAFLLSLLGDLNDDDSLQTFLSFLPSGEAMVRTASMRGISRIHHNLPPEVLIPSAADEVPSVRKFCAVALGTSREADAIKTLIMLLADGHYAVRFAAFESLRDKQEGARASLLDMIKKPDRYPEYARKLAGDLLEGDNGRKTPAERTIRDTP